MRSQVTDMVSAVTRAVGEEVRANPRVRKMSWVIGYILCFYLILSLSDFNTSIGKQSVAMHAEISRIIKGAETSEDIWEVRLTDEKRVQEQVVQYCWKAGDPRLASADMQTELQKLYRDYDLKNSRLSLSDPETVEWDQGTLWLIRGEVKGRSTLAGLPSIVNALENSRNRFFVKELQFVKQGNGGTLNLRLAACFVSGEPDE